MVGVPRSKGCRICVQRRVRCDQTRPTCNNCKKGNRPCPGYGNDLKFQDEGQRLRQRYKPDTANVIVFDSSTSDSPPSSESTNTSPESSAETAPTSKSSHATFPHTEDNEWDMVGVDIKHSQRKTFIGLLEGKREKYIGMEDEPVPDPEVEVIFNPYSNHTPGEFSIFDNFKDNPHRLPTMAPVSHIYSPQLQQGQLVSVFHHNMITDHRSNGPIPKQMRNHTRWLDHLPVLTGTNSLLDTAVRAVTLVHIGRLNKSDRFISESRPYYGQALRLLNTTLQSRDDGLSNETLCATILLSFYEMFASDNNQSWIRHAGGAGALIKMRGAKRHRTGFDREIFLAYRYTLIIEAFERDMACFLEEPEWREVSKQIHDDLKASGIPQHRLEIFDVVNEYYNAMVPLPGIACQARQYYRSLHIPGCPAPSVPRAVLVEKLQAARNLFKSTFTRFEEALKRVGHSPTISLASSDPVVSIDYHFVNTFVSSSFTGYWTVLSVANLCLQGLVQRHDAELVSLYAQENRENALNIMRSTAYSLTSSFLGPFFTIFGLRIALLVFEDLGGPECDWIIRKLFDIGDRHMGMAKHVPGYESGMSVSEVLLKYKRVRLLAARTEEQRKQWERHVREAEMLARNTASVNEIGTMNDISWDGILGNAKADIMAEELEEVTRQSTAITDKFFS